MSISERERIELNDVLLQLLDGAYALVDSEGADFSAAFHSLPSRSLGDYYKIIKTPMSYSKIKLACKSRKYTLPQTFVEDLTQIDWNARFFNDEASVYYQWAVILDNYIKETVIPQLRSNKRLYRHEDVGYPNLGPLPNDPNYVPLPPPSSSNTILQNSNSNSNAASVSPHLQHPDLNTGSATVSRVTPATNTIRLVNHQRTASPNVVLEDEEEEEIEEGEREQVHPNATMNTLSVNHSNTAPTTTGTLSNNNHNDSSANLNHLGLGLGLPTYHPSTYVARVQETGAPNVYLPPRMSNINVINNRQTLEQWVKRGRPPIVDKPHEQRIKSIMRGLKKIKVGAKTIVSFWDKLPNAQDHPDYLKIVRDPISMLDIKGLIKQRYYTSVDQYIADVFKLINNNRMYYTTNDFMKNKLDLLETNISKLYQIEMAKPDSEYISGHQTGRTPLPYVVHGGRTYKVGNWVLMKNPNDDEKPIVGQIFRIWQEGGKSRVNVCWYYRPEWTVHRYDRLFLDNEVVKTGQYRDHNVDDIVGPCYVAYFTRWLKGDPGVIYEGPLYICEFRYNDREMSFAKIRTWKACLPDEVRHIEDPIKPLNSPRVLKKFPSPIKHLLPPNANSHSAIPQPLISNLNAPPLVGGVFVRRDNDEEDVHYFDATLSPTQFKTYIPPTTNIRIPSSAIVDTPIAINSTPMLMNHNGMNGNNHHLQQHQQNQQIQSQAQGLHMPGDLSGVIDLSKSQKPNLPMGANNPSSFGQPSNFHQPPSLQSLSTQQLNTLRSKVVNSTTKFQQRINLPKHNMAFLKFIGSPYNRQTVQWSPYSSSSNSNTFVQQNGNEWKLQNWIKNQYSQLDNTNFERIKKSLKSQNEQSVGKLGKSWIKYYAEDEDDEDEEGEFERPLLWFKAPPLKITDRIINEEFDEPLTSLKRKSALETKAGIKRVKLGHSVKYLKWKLEQQQKQKEQEVSAN